MPDGKVLNEKNFNGFLDLFTSSDREEKQKMGEEFTMQDSTKSAKENYEILYGLMNLELTFKTNNICLGKVFIDGKIQNKETKYKYHPDTKVVDGIDENGEITSSFLLKKEENTIHLYFAGEEMGAFSLLGLKLYLKKVKA
jgi:hypothetical protein